MEHIPNPKDQLIDDFLSGKLSADQKEAFERDLANDPSLNSSMEHQKMIIQSIRDARKAELKQLLQSTPVPTGLSTLSKIAIAATIIGISSTLGFVLFTNNESQTTSDITVVKPAESTSSTIINSEENTNASPAPVEKAVNHSTSSTPVHQKESNRQEPTVPMPSDLNDDIQLDDNDTYREISGSVSTDSEQITPTIINKSNKFHYKYDGSDLTLIGDFRSTEPYTIHEKTQNKTIVLFLEYQKGIYEIKNTNGDVERLIMVKDKKIIREFIK